MMVVHNYIKKKKERGEERKKKKINFYTLVYSVLVPYKNFFFVGNYDMFIILS
jgi:hypothetical protein